MPMAKLFRNKRGDTDLMSVILIIVMLVIAFVYLSQSGFLGSGNNGGESSVEWDNDWNATVIQICSNVTVQVGWNDTWNSVVQAIIDENGLTNWNDAWNATVNDLIAQYAFAWDGTWNSTVLELCASISHVYDWNDTWNSVVQGIIDDNNLTTWNNAWNATIEDIIVNYDFSFGNAYDYIIEVGSGVYEAIDGKTGKISYSDSNARNLFQSVVNHAQINIFVKEGNYPLFRSDYEPLYVTYPDVYIKGQKGAVFTNTYTPWQLIFVMNGANGFKIEGIKFDNSMTTSLICLTYGNSHSHLKDVTIDHCEFTGTVGAVVGYGDYGYTSDIDGVTFTNNYIHDITTSGNCGLELFNTTNIDVSGNWFNNTYGVNGLISLHDCSDIRIHDNLVTNANGGAQGGGYYVFFISSTTGWNPQSRGCNNIRIHDNTLNQSGGIGCEVSSQTVISITSNTVIGYGTNVTDRGIGVEGTSSSYLTDIVVSNNIIKNMREGIVVIRMNRSQIIGNVIDTSFNDGIFVYDGSFNQINGNIIYNSNRNNNTDGYYCWGISIGYMFNSTIIGNTVYDVGTPYQRYAIYEASDSNFNLIALNYACNSVNSPPILKQGANSTEIHNITN